MTESELDSQITSTLAKLGFEVTRQAKSLCRKYRCDIFARHKEYKWLVFGIENKKPSLKRRGAFQAKTINQASNYSKAQWFAFGEVHDTVPWTINGISERDFAYLKDGKQKHSVSHSHSNVNSLIFGLSGVGEMDIYNANGYRVFRIRFNNLSLYEARGFPDGSIYEIASENNYQTIKGQISKIHNP